MYIKYLICTLSKNNAYNIGDRKIPTQSNSVKEFKTWRHDSRIIELNLNCNFLNNTMM